MSSQPQPLFSKPTITSPASSPEPELEGFHKGQEIAFIYNRTDLISGIVVDVNLDGTYDLECLVPLSIRKLDWKGSPGRSDYNISRQVKLSSTPFLKATPVDPRMIAIKTVASLESLGIDKPEPTSLIQQSSASFWKDSGKRLRIPRLTEFLAPLVGHFFDSSLFYYKIICWRAPIRVRNESEIPEETRYFPNPDKKPFYTSFKPCFERYVKEYLEQLDRWNRVEIQALLPEDVKE